MSEESIFVSYSSRDRDFAMLLTKELQNLGASIWIDQLGIGLGENWDNSIEDALEVANTLLLLISKTSATSQNVQDEVSIAKGTDKKIVPILIEQCKLPMRWQRMQYADYIATPEKAMKNVLTVLNLDEQTASNFQSLISSLTSTTHDNLNSTDSNISKTQRPQNENPKNTEDLLISEQEIYRATKMHKRAIKKNWQLIAFVGLSSIVLLAILFIFFKESQTLWLTIVGGLLINLLAIKPYGSISKRAKNMELIDLLKLKRDRLIRVINKLSKNEIENFNSEFDNYITV